MREKSFKDTEQYVTVPHSLRGDRLPPYPLGLLESTEKGKFVSSGKDRKQQVLEHTTFLSTR